MAKTFDDLTYAQILRALKQLGQTHPIEIVEEIFIAEADIILCRYQGKRFNVKFDLAYGPFLEGVEEISRVEREQLEALIVLENKMTIDINSLDWEKTDGLIPVIIQDEQTLEVLMLGYMNAEALAKTQAEGKVTFFSRSKNRLWTKGEESGNFLFVKAIDTDCDKDTLLIKASPVGPTCHTGSRSCFNTDYNQNFIFELENIVKDRFENPTAESYVNKLRNKGLNKIAQKVGEEGVETVIAALNETDEDFVNEASDLVFHLLVLLKAKGKTLEDIAVNLEKRHK